MTTTEKMRTRLIKKLNELFQLNQPDLDFGFYRIMHAKAEEVQSFINTDLLQIVSDAFGEVDESKWSELQASYEQALQTAREFGAPNPEETEGVKKAKAALAAVKDSAGNEAEIYDHLYRFFERYYDDGDFISRRYYTRETSGKAAPFAVPYNGEEVKLHWANADQYYVKSAEYFSNFSFDLVHSAEVRAMSSDERTLNNIPDEPHMVHFRVVEASEGEHGNVKASDATKRFFIIHKDKPVEFNDAGELVVNFEYRNDPEKTGQDSTWRDKRIAEAVDTILKSDIDHARWELYKQLLTIPAPTEKEKVRPVLAKYINQYTSRNTKDYFIHKDLGTFLKRELDFYIKNEIMQLDDIENADVPAVESYLSKIKVLRKIAGKLIDFLAQMENFQKKLWLKRKFVVETNYCITMDRVPEELYPEIIANGSQLKEWVELFAIDEIKGEEGFPEIASPGFSKPLTIEFLKANDKLVLDTKFFDEEFKARLIASIEDFDEQCDGLLIHSENFQALNLLQERYREQVKCVYIDPPYNTGKDGFIYKDGYGSSSWSSMINASLSKVKSILSDDSLFFVSNDDNENDHLKNLIIQNSLLFKTNLIWNTDGHTDNQFEVKVNHEYITLIQKTENASYGNVIDPNTREESNLWKNIAENSITKNGPANPFSEVTLPEGFPVNGDDGVIEKDVPPKDYFAELGSLAYYPRNLNKKYNVNFPIKFNSAHYLNGELSEPLKISAGWANLNKLLRFIENGCSPFDDNGGVLQFYLSENGTVYYRKGKEASRNIVSVLRNFTTTEKMKYELEHMDIVFSYPKPKDLIEYILRIGNSKLNLDYFAGSGTTGHAVINLNREDNGNRKYILVEMGDYFDTVLKPRIAKVIYSENWKNGKPTTRDTGISQCVKYLRLESYEDTLNNLQFADDPQRRKALASNPYLKQDYMLGYMIDVETRGSQSLLNIDAFADPTFYTLKVKKPGTDEYAIRNVDLLETFNYLIGLRVQHIAAPVSFSASFTRMKDPELPEDQNTRLMVEGKIQQDENGPWWFRKVEGWVPKDPLNPDNGQKEKVLVVWRKLTGNLEEDNLMLDEWFQKNRISTRDFEFDTIYVNGSNNLPNLKLDSDTWKVRLTEEQFSKRMWNVEEL
ncbi:MAG: adenine-specific DNA-methyltransferase [Sphaerochaeta sp.]|jgi:adenine-specific DNA-methyltransferase|nr:adenine-specific DNA-methyltransferase [Sphaerochaeta sp.]